ncbi:MAG: carbohydrate ABC transporter permease, partial [Spirochaetota bacterium]
MMNKQGTIWTIFSYAFLALVAVVVLFPLLNIVIVSLNSEADLARNPLNLTLQPKFSNYVAGFEKSNFLKYGVNTIAILVAVVIANILACAMAAYAITRFNFREVRLSYYLLISGMFVPAQLIIIPLFGTLKVLHILNTLFSLALVYSAVNIPISLIIFAGFFKSIPRELEESALIDGCGYFQSFFRIILPIASVPAATCSILVSLYVWRDFFLPLVLILSPAKKTLAVGLLAFMNQYSTDWNPLSAAMVLQILPFVILFLFFQRYFIKGI